MAERVISGFSGRFLVDLTSDARPLLGRAGRVCLLFFCFVAISWFDFPSAQAASLTAELDRQVVPMGESVTLSLIFQDAAPPGTPTLPALPNLRVVSTGQKQEVNMINGQMSSRNIFTYILIPTTPGDITIPPMQMQVGGQVLATSTLSLKVLPAGAKPPPGQGPTNETAFLRLVVPKTELYVGEGFPVEIQLFWQNAQDIQMPQLKAEGFTLGTASKPAQSQTQVNGVPYNLAVFRMAAVAAKPGQLQLGPAECNLTVLVPAQSRRRDPFDAFGLFGPRMQGRPTVLQSPALTLNVRPLPVDNVPEIFAGAVGNYTLTLTAGPTNLAVGDPITLHVTLSGTGPLDSLALPAQPQWRDFQPYPPTSKVEPRDEIGLSGSKIFEQVVIPQNHEIRALPPFAFAYFDPSARVYKELRSPPVPLTLRPTLAATPPPLITNAPAKTDSGDQADDIVHIRAQLDTLALAHPPLVHQPWFLVLQGAPVLAWLGLLIARRRRESIARNPRLQRQRQVGRRVRTGLENLKSLAIQRRSDEFFVELFRLLQEQLGERLNLPATAITEAVIDERLDGRLQPGQVTELHALFQACNQARYAPSQSSEELASLVPRASDALAALQRMKPAL